MGLIGFVLVDKPAGLTSHDVVARLRRRTGERRIGHAGTLDPPATGLLVVGVGAATRLLRFVTAWPKSYEATICFGTETTTGDAEGEVVATHQMTLDLERVRDAAQRFVGTISQVPPAVSAVKVDGRRAHELARAGETPQLEPREVVIYDFTISPTDQPAVFAATVTCGSGTYIRSLAVDLGRALGGSAHVGSLRRTRSGPLSVDEAQPLDDARQFEGAQPFDEAHLLEPATIARGLAHLTLSHAEAAVVANGGRLDPERFGVGAEASQPTAGPWALLDADGRLVAVHEREGGVVRPAVVMPTERPAGRR